MSQKIEYLSAETEAGKRAIYEVMEPSFREELNESLSEWSIARVVDDVPVSFVIIDPFRTLDFGSGKIRYAFVGDIATREDRRREGHFRSLMEYSFQKIKSSGIAVVLLHGRNDLYQNRFGFTTFTYHQGLFTSPARIRTFFHNETATDGVKQLKLLSRGVYDDLLVVTDVEVATREDCVQLLKLSAETADHMGKDRILIEYPFHSERESTYPAFLSPNSLFTQFAEIVGVNIVRMAAYPEEGPVFHADWISIIDAYMLLLQTCSLAGDRQADIESSLNIIVQGQFVSIKCHENALSVSSERMPAAPTIELESEELARLFTGFYDIDDIAALKKEYELDSAAMDLLRALFPKTWRYSRNENWTYKQ